MNAAFWGGRALMFARRRSIFLTTRAFARAGFPRKECGMGNGSARLVAAVRRTAPAVGGALALLTAASALAAGSSTAGAHAAADEQGRSLRLRYRFTIA